MSIPPTSRVVLGYGSPREDFPANRAPMGSYFGEFLGLLRESLQPSGSEFGHGLTLFSLAVSIKAVKIIEIGRFRGFSTLALASALKLLDIGWTEPQQHKQRPDVNYLEFEAPKLRQVISIDLVPNPDAVAVIARAGLQQYVRFVDARSDQVHLAGQADLILIDGDHTYAGCRADVAALIPAHLRPGGYFILHDYFGWYDEKKANHSPIKAVIDEIVATGEMQHLLIDTGYMSFVIFRKPNPASDH
jgi:predicted O-methyltransferase YrrM